MAPSVIAVAGDAANGVVGADIYFPDVEPFASNPVNQRYIAKVQQMHKLTPDKFMALGAAALQVWAQAANELKTLDRKRRTALSCSEAYKEHCIVRESLKRFFGFGAERDVCLSSDRLYSTLLTNRSFQLLKTLQRKRAITAFLLNHIAEPLGVV